MSNDIKDKDSVGEREAFEKFIVDTAHQENLGPPKWFLQRRKDEWGEEEYLHPNVSAAWHGWKGKGEAQHSQPADLVERCRLMAKMLRTRKGWAKAIPIHGDSIAADFEQAAKYVEAALSALPSQPDTRDEELTNE